MEYIQSRQNPLIQHLKKLRTSRSDRYRCGEFVADGTKLLEEAVHWCGGLHTVVLQEGVAAKLPEGLRAVTVPEPLMRYLSGMEAPQGALFLCKMPESAPLTVAGGSLILDGLQDPGNLGTILRTADALEVPVILTEGCADPYGEKTVRASMGAVFRRAPQQATRAEVLRHCAARGIPIGVTALTEDAVDLRQAALEKMALVVGSEGQGVCREFLEAAAQRLIIPMNKHCESLNAAVAASIVMWQMKR
ncbi:MAG: RNA methyltransferase [Oscillospiraceae bacterium]|nr:RNA methyltransferase [Oscillospiraceae bacterium]